MVFPELVAPALGGTGLWPSTFIETVPLFLLSLGLFLVLELIRRRLFQAIGYPEIMSADTVTNPFPERPIRPLPKRRLRERLSPDVADAIEYPPLPSSTTPLFSYSCASKDEDLESTGIASRERGAISVEGGYVAHSIESDGDDASGRRTLVARSSWRATARSRQAPRQDVSRAQNAQPPPSTDSSADGYDSFENTNNKKKRKIPTTGDLSLNGSHGMNDGAVASSPTSDFHGDGSGVATAYHGSGGFISSSPGISGPGRGRYGRSRTGRSPLRALSDASNNWAGRGGKFRPSQWAMQTGENSGIISNAIANAEKLPSQHGQENVSLLQQRQLSTKSSPASTQFTFTCDSQVPGNLTWPGPEHGTGLPPTHAAEPQWVQDRLVGKDMAPARTSGPNNLGQQAPKQGTGKKKSRRKLMNELQRQAQDRQREQAMKNYESPPKDGEDLYVCPYCEFEMLIGHKPRALLYDFEMKERKKRLEEERRRRLLDKAKARGRKGRKAKSAGKTSGVTDAQSSAGQQAPPMQPSHSQDTRSEGDEEEEYVDGSEDRSGDAPQPGVTTDLGQNTALAERSAKDDGGGHPGGGTGGEPGTT